MAQCPGCATTLETFDDLREACPACALVVVHTPLPEPAPPPDRRYLDLRPRRDLQ